MAEESEKKMKIKKYIFNGFGFPVELKNVPAREIRGSIEPVINYKDLALKVISEICSDENEAPLTGNQVRFLRQHLNMTTREFGAFTENTHVAVLKWEKSGDEATVMSASTEMILRLKVLESLGIAPAKFFKVFQNMRIDRDHESSGLVHLSL
jgi:DNA-binding transcriptional regulator YiaG